MTDNLPISEQYHIIAKKWVDADAAANILEETKTLVLAQKMRALGNIPVSRAEMITKASPEWYEFIEKMVEARKQANLLRVQLKYLEMKSWQLNSEEATKRAEMKL